MPENRSPAIGFVHLAHVPGETVADESLRQIFVRLSGRPRSDVRRPHAPRIAADCLFNDEPRTVLPSVATGCVRVRVLVRPADVTHIEANVDQLNKDLSTEAIALADRIAAMSRAG